jgi:hypothetical protein
MFNLFDNRNILFYRITWCLVEQELPTIPELPYPSFELTCKQDIITAVNHLYFNSVWKDTNGLIRIRKLKNRQHNGQTKKDNKTKNDLQNIHIKLKIE